jgi:hypothetical protein
MRRMIALLGGVLLGVVLSQFPEYAQQYTQRLGGAVDELRIITAEFDRAANDAGLSRDAALARYAVADDTFIAGRGRSMEATFIRYGELSATLARIRGANALERAALLPQYLDTEIGARALEAFQPAVPVTLEGFAYAGAGLFLGYAALSGLLRLLVLPFRRRRTGRGSEI